MAEPTGWKMVLGPLISTVFAILQAVVLGYFAFYLKDRVEADLKERAQTVSSLQAMQTVLEKLKESDMYSNALSRGTNGRGAIRERINKSVDAVDGVLK